MDTTGMGRGGGVFLWGRGTGLIVFLMKKGGQSCWGRIERKGGSAAFRGNKRNYLQARGIRGGLLVAWFFDGRGKSGRRRSN